MPDLKAQTLRVPKLRSSANSLGPPYACSSLQAAWELLRSQRFWPEHKRALAAQGYNILEDVRARLKHKSLTRRS